MSHACLSITAWLSFSLDCLCVQAKPLQSCLSPMDCSPPAPLARILQWVAMPSSRESSQLRDQIHISRSPSLAGKFFTTSATWEALESLYFPSIAYWTSARSARSSARIFSPVKAFLIHPGTTDISSCRIPKVCNKEPLL